MTGRPSGGTVDLSPDALAFTSTDYLGRIDSVNSVFLKVSQYNLDEVLGAPHSIVRHPGMPAGVFVVMWELLSAGRPVAAYVKNMTRDGAAYWAFLTITPFRDRFLAVQTAPQCPDLLAAVSNAYDEVRMVENGAQALGMARSAAAKVGSRAVIERIAALGFPTYEALVRHLVPAEMAARAANAEPPSHGRVGGPIGDLLYGVDQIDVELEALLTRLGGLQGVADGVRRSSGMTQRTVVGLLEAMNLALRASGTVQDTAPVLGRAAGTMAAGARTVAQTLRALSSDLVSVWHGILELRFRIALSRLHADLLRCFAQEIADAQVGSGSGGARGTNSILRICGALEEAVMGLTQGMSQLTSVLGAVQTRVDEANSQLRSTQRELATWRLLIPRYGLSHELDRHLNPIDAQLGAGHLQMAELADLASRCATEARPFKSGELEYAIKVIKCASEEIGVAEADES